MKTIVHSLILALSVLFTTEPVNNTNAAIKIQPGESLRYEVSYEMRGLMTRFGEVKMETETVKTKKSKLLHLKCTAVSYSKWDSYFKVRDLYESYVTPDGLVPRLYKRDIDEGGHAKYRKYVFSYSKGQIKSTFKKKKWTYDNKIVGIGPSTVDIVTAIYRMRTVDWSTMKPGQKQSISVVFDENETTVQVKYRGTESVNSKHTGSINCHKLEILVPSSAAVNNNGGNILYLSNDEKQAPVRATFDIPVGKGQMELISATYN